MSALKILPDIYSVGVVDWGVRSFHGHTYSTNRGTTYNAYLIIDEKIALVDTVLGTFTQELIDNIRQVVPVEKIDYIIANHVETDHSGALPEVWKLCPKAKVFGTERCKEGLYRNYYGKWEFQAVKTNDKLKLGKRTLQFIEAPMIHWPDSMFTYCPQEELLMPNDAFGQHYATAERFDDETDQCALMDETAKYFGNILWPLGSVILKKIEEIQKMNLPIKMIAPSHGVIWRKEPMTPVNSYIRWSKNETRPKVVVAFETMWGATEKMARKIVEGIADSGIEVKLFDVPTSDRSEIIKEMLEAKGFMFGSSTHDNDMLPNIAGFLEFIKGLKPKNRLASVFGSHGWAGGALKEMEGVLKEAGLELAQSALAIKYVPDEKELIQCYNYGKDFAAKIK
ncbi:MAG: flavodoxin domain-containing protein [Candidatus Omnitrophota bacterium]